MQRAAPIGDSLSCPWLSSGERRLQKGEGTMRAFLRASGRCILCVFIALFAHSVAVRAADFEVKVFRANGDSYREEDVEQVKREISLEWAQLQTRRAELDKETKRQTGEVSMP